MEMAYEAALALTVQEADLEKMEMPEYDTFMGTLETQEVTLDAFGKMVQAHGYGDDIPKIFEIDSEIFETLHDAYRAFTAAFESVKGIRISLEYHDNFENGDQYDQVDGAFFALDFNAVFQLTPEAKALSENMAISSAFFVELK